MIVRVIKLGNTWVQDVNGSFINLDRVAYFCVERDDRQLPEQKFRVVAFLDMKGLDIKLFGVLTGYVFDGSDAAEESIAEFLKSNVQRTTVF